MGEWGFAVGDYAFEVLTVVFDWLESNDGTKSLAIAPTVAAAAVTS